jgi:hypothetical protein
MRDAPPRARGVQKHVSEYRLGTFCDPSRQTQQRFLGRVLMGQLTNQPSSPHHTGCPINRWIAFERPRYNVLRWQEVREDEGAIGPGRVGDCTRSP